MIVKLLTEHHLEFLSLKGGCRGSSESTHVKMPNIMHWLICVICDIIGINYHSEIVVFVFTINCLHFKSIGSAVAQW